MRGLIVILAGLGSVCWASEVLNAPLTIRRDREQSYSLTLYFPGNPQQVRIGRAPGETQVRLEPAAEGGYQVTVDSDGDGKWEGETPQLLLPRRSVRVEVWRGKGDHRVKLPYRIWYDAEGGESFRWSAAYRAEGVVRSGGCSLNVSALDLDSDGVFDEHDFHLGPSLLLSNGVESVEPRQAGEVIRWCEANWEIDGIAADGSMLRWRKSTLPLVGLGETVPPFVLYSFANAPVPWDQYRGRAVLLDFWASWCTACLENHPALKGMQQRWGDSLQVVSINVETDERQKYIDRVLERWKPAWPQARLSEGRDSAMWRVFGSLPGVHLGLPLYAVLDAEGRLAFYTDGSHGLRELDQAIGRAVRQPPGGQTATPGR